MEQQTSPVKQRDVFICFSKARAGEAKVAIALKDQLEQLGLFAFEYEDWNWVASGISNEEPEVDRATLRHMLTHTSVVVLISPHSGLPSAGVQTEIEELRNCRSPVILLHWSPEGWHPLLDPPGLAGLNIVWSYEGRTSGQQDVSQNQCVHIAQQLSLASWLACQLHYFSDKHPRTAARLLSMIPQGEMHPLLNFRLDSSNTDMSDEQELPDVDMLSTSVAGEADIADLQEYAYEWRAGVDLIAQLITNQARFSLIKPLRTFYTACESLYQQASHRVPGIQELPGDVLLRRGLTMARLDQVDEAVQTLQHSLDHIAADRHYEVYQALSLAQESNNIDSAILNAGLAIDSASHLETRCTLIYNRGSLNLRHARDPASALEDFTYVYDHSEILAMRHSALRGRARVHTQNGNFEAAIADYSQILIDADLTPRTAVSAWMDRGALYKEQGDLPKAIADWTLAIEHADADQLQRFRALEARAGAFEKSGYPHQAAADYEAMTHYSFIAPGYRKELKEKIASISLQAGGNKEASIS